MTFKYRFILPFLLLCFSSVLSADHIELSKEEKSWIQNNNIVSYIGSQNWLPYEAFDRDGTYLGIVAEHLKYVEKRTGLNFSPKLVKTWSESLDIAAQGKITVISGDAADKVLAQNFKAIEPYLINPIVIVMNEKTNYIDDLNTLQDKKIAIIKDYGYTADVYTHYPQMKFIEVNNIQDGLNGVSNGKYDALLASNALARYIISDMGLDKIKIVGKTTVIMELTLFVDKREPVLFNIINKAIKSISAKEQNEIIKKWTILQPSSFNTTSLITIGILITFLISFLIHTIIMIKKNNKHFLYMKKLESAQKVGHLGSWEWNMITGKLVWSDEVYRIFGEVPQSFPASYDAFKSYIPKEFHEGLEGAITKATESHTPYEFDHQILQKDGSLRFVREAGYIRYDDKAQPISMFGTILDIDSITRAKTTSKENKELKELLEKFDNNVIASNTDLKGNITYVSKAFCEISGYRVDELIGKPQNIVRHPETSVETFIDLWTTIQSGETWKGELKNRTKDGQEYWVYSSISPNYDEYGKVNGYSAIRRDITHEKKVESLHQSLKLKSSQLQVLNDELEKRIEEAVAQSKEKDQIMSHQSKLASMGEMIGNIAHQWRQPLNALSLLLQKQQILYDRNLLTSEKFKEGIDKGTTLINKMSSTIDDFRDFFKPNKTKLPFDVKDAIEGTCKLIDASLYNKSIQLTLNIQDNITVNGYENEFSQVILNIINNAQDALIQKKVKNSEIKIYTKFEEKIINIFIEDNAGGIPKDQIQRIFEPYFTTKEEGKGTGIGLYMSKMIIEENMSGRLSVVNGDKGAVFSISLEIEVNS